VLGGRAGGGGSIRDAVLDAGVDAGGSEEVQYQRKNHRQNYLC